MQIPALIIGRVRVGMTGSGRTPPLNKGLRYGKVAGTRMSLLAAAAVDGGEAAAGLYNRRPNGENPTKSSCGKERYEGCKQLTHTTAPVGSKKGSRATLFINIKHERKSSDKC